MKKAIIIILVMLSAVYTEAQNFNTVTEKYTNLNDIKRELEPYFKKQRELLGDEKFFHEGSEYSAYRSYLAYWEPLLHPHGDFTKYYKAEEAYWNSQEKKGGSKTTSKTYDNSGDWFELGPKFDSSNRDNGVGPIEFISIDKNNPSQMIAGSLNGGLFYTNDNAVSWENLGSDQWENSGVASAIFHPYLQNVFYACSIKRQDNGNPSYIGSQGKIKRRVGSSWETIGSYTDFEGDFYTKYYKILADPLNNPGTNGVPLRLYVATLYGLYRTDGANDPTPISWTKDPHPLLDGKVYDVEFVPNQTGSSANRIVATVYNDTTDTWQAVYTTNRGLTWQPLPNHPLLTGNTANLTIEVSDADSDIVYLYHGYTSRKVYRFNWSTGVWTEIYSFTDSSNFGSGNAFGVSNTNANHIAINRGTTMRITRDGGSSWSYEHPGHVDLEDIVWHPTDGDKIYLGNHGGVYESLDNGDTFHYQSNGIGNAEVEGMATSYTNPGRIALGLFHDGSMVSLNSYDYTGNFVPDWNARLSCCDDLKPLIDYTDPDKVWLATQTIWNSSFRYYEDINYETYNSLYESTEFKSSGWEKASVLNIIDPSIIYYNYERATTGNRDVLRAESYGVTDRYSISNFGVTHGLSDYFVYRLYTDPHNVNTLYAYVVDKSSLSIVFRVYRTNKANENETTATGSWEELEIPDDSRWIADINFSYENPKTVYFSYSSNIQNAATATGANMFYSVDYSTTNSCVIGTNCFDLTGNLPNGHSGRFSTAVERGTNEGIYFATNFGVYYTNKEMVSGSEKVWVPVGSNSPHVVPHGLEINYKVNKLRIAYFGRGVWEHDLFCPDDWDAVESGIYFDDLFLEVRNNITSNAIVLPGKNVDYRAGNTIELNPGFKATTGSDFFAFIHPCNESGSSFRTANNSVNIIDNIYYNDNSIDENGITLYPNPTAGETVVHVKNYIKGIDYEITIHDIQGIQQLKLNTKTQKTVLNLNQLATGIYIVKVSNGINSYTTKLIKQ